MDHLTKLLLLRFLILIFTLPRAKMQTIGTDCNGKGFLCVDTDRYQVCMDLPSGRSETVDAIAYPCAPGSYCASDSLFECDSLVRPTSSRAGATSGADSSTLSTTSVVPIFESETSNTTLEALSTTSSEASSETPLSTIPQNPESATSTETDFLTSEETTDTSTLGPETPSVGTTSDTDTIQSSTDLEDTSTSDDPLDSSSTQSADTSNATLQSSYSTSVEPTEQSSIEDDPSGTSSVETTPDDTESTSNFESSSSETTSFSTTERATESISIFVSPTTQVSATTSNTESETSSTTLETIEVSSATEVSTTEQITTTIEPFVCKAPGRYPHETDCHKYYNCLPLPDGLFMTEMTCFYNMAYEPVTQRCVIDQSTCQREQPFVCTAVGKFPDPLNADRYFWCLQNGPDYHLYTMNCPSGQQFYADVEQCTGSISGNTSIDSESSNDSDDSSSSLSESSEE